MGNVHRCVVRNQAYRKTGLEIRERHNERSNTGYANADIDPARASFNVHFKHCADSYTTTFNRMVESGMISTRGLKPDAKVVDELVFDVNSAYFENHGGYEYAKTFFAEAYRCAVNEVGGEQYVLSAVMHADERNSALSEQLGHDVFHYHLHVVYVPVVDKEIYFKKNNKDPEKAGKLREVIKQVSHSKKWPRLKRLDENGEVSRNAKGKAVLVNAYSLLQDHFYEHMREQGFTDFERGERGSTAEHLSVLEYKTQQEKERAAALAATVEQKRQTAATLDRTIGNKTQAAAELDDQTAKKQKQLDGLERKTAIVKDEAVTFAEIDAIGKPALLGGYSLTADEIKRLKTLAKEAVKTRPVISDLKKRVADFIQRVAQLERELKQYKGLGITESMKYYQAKQRAPHRLAEMVADIMKEPPEKSGQQHASPVRGRGHGIEH